MKAHTLLRLLVGGMLGTMAYTSVAQHPDSLWFKFDDRFTANRVWAMPSSDSIIFRNLKLVIYHPTESRDSLSTYYSVFGATKGDFVFKNPGRILCKPSSMNCDFTNSASQWCFERSMESEHFVVFWEKGVEFDKNYILERAERAWDVYVNQLGFIVPGNSKGTDTYKIVMRMYNNSDWVASGSGEDKKVGTLNLSPSAYQARGGHTVAHEVGHTFQYLTDVDNGANGSHGFGWGFASDGSGDNCFWEDCANWQAYKVYPERQFTDGEYFEGYMNCCHLNLLHEDARYNNCFYQDYLCQEYGKTFIGQVWRESKRPEDPVDVIRRLKSLSQDDFSQLMYNCFSHMCTWDIDDVRAQAKHRIGAHPYRLESRDVEGVEWFQPSTQYAPQNYGYNITELKLPTTSDRTLQVHFQGLVNEEGYKTVYAERAGWRWGLVTLMQDGSTQYGEMQSSKEGTLSYQVPAEAKRLWLVVMGAPTTWWHHEWSRWAEAPSTNNEQWPYRVRFDGTRPSKQPHIYTEADFPDDYQRHDTTVVIEATLPYSSSNYSSVTVQYDMDAICEALGITTEQLKSVKPGTDKLSFIGVTPSGSIYTSTTTSTSSATVFGHWFTTTGAICSYGSSSAVFAEMTPANFACKVGQYPGRLTVGKTYTIRQAVMYKVGSKKYKAIMMVKLTII